MPPFQGYAFEINKVEDCRIWAVACLARLCQAAKSTNLEIKVGENGGWVYARLFSKRVNSTLLTYFKALKGRVHLTQGAALC